MLRRITMLSLLLLPALARAEPDPAASASLLQQAEAAEHAAQPQEALALYRSVLASSSGASLTRIVKARIDWIEERSTGDFVPLARLMRLQALPPSQVTAEQLSDFERTIPALPAGTLRRESWMLTGKTWLDELHDPAAAERTYRAWLQDPHPDESARQIATTGLARSRLMQGHTLEALAILREAGYTRIEAYLQMQAILARRIGDPIAIACVALFSLLTLSLLFFRPLPAVLRGALRPGDMLLTLYVLVIPCLLATRYDPSVRAMFTRLALALAVVVSGALVAGSALRERPVPAALRVAVAVAAVLACAGAGFLTFDQSELLEGMLRWRGL